MLSIVGARACTGYGSYIAGALGADLASAGIAVVSGAALGIDAAAHRGALAVGGPTIAVLACGIDRVYPRAHEVLLHAIAERGAVLSELPPGAAPTRFRFLHRNRIIAALGVGTVVVEAALRSGSLVTARLAAELGRVVMAVPGPVTSDQSAGAHELIRDGATLVTEASQVREAYASLTAASRESRGVIASSAPSARRAQAARWAPARPVRPAEPADPVEELLIEALPSATGGTGFGADVFALARATGVGPDAVFAALGRLAATGRVVKAGGGWMLSPAR
jgi:DNA processing protein